MQDTKKLVLILLALLLGLVLLLIPFYLLPVLLLAACWYNPFHSVYNIRPPGPRSFICFRSVVLSSLPQPSWFHLFLRSKLPFLFSSSLPIFFIPRSFFSVRCVLQPLDVDWDWFEIQKRRKSLLTDRFSEAKIPSNLDVIIIG
jgi:hypothetical protein